jgi:hypothetical protein
MAGENRLSASLEEGPEALTEFLRGNPLQWFPEKSQPRSGKTYLIGRVIAPEIEATVR